MKGYFCCLIVSAVFFSFAASAAEEKKAPSFLSSRLGPDAWNWEPKFRQWPRPHPQPSALKARITLLDIGRILVKVNGNGKDFEYIPTIALIEDGSDKVIFDTGLPTDNESLNRMLTSLKNLGLPPTSITKVILSHAHLDHVGHGDTFTKATIYHGNHMFNGFSLTYIGTYEFGGYNVTKNVRIIPTPGHTPTCISALVTNAETLNSSSTFSTSLKATPLGVVAITGDLFFNVTDLTVEDIWKSSALDIEQQKTSRTAVMCDADYIIPGHGQMFKVPADKKVGCPGKNCIEVKYGDTFYDLCINKLKSTMASCIANSSHITNPDVIFPGQLVCA